MTTTAIPTPQKPPKLPKPRSGAEVRLASERLRGAAVLESWLPEGLHPAVDDARAEHLTRLAQLRAACDAVTTLDAQHADEDAKYLADLKAAAREAKPSPADKRTPKAQRELDREALVDRAWIAASVLSDAVDAAMNVLADNEDAILATLHERAGRADEKRRKAEAAARDSRNVQFAVEQAAKWTLDTVDGGPFRNAAPALSVPAPRSWAPQPLGRPWHRPSPTKEAA